jgi:catechol 2,3-dioxygenase-like lactoylglutathione lyase family enzyme
MKDYIISGIQQMGVGVSNLQTSWRWYIDNFGMDCPIFEEEAEAKLMLPYTGGEPRSRHAVLVYNLQSGGGFEIWQYKGRIPQEASEEIRTGMLGIFACKIKVKDVLKTYGSFSGKGIKTSGSPLPDPSGRLTFFVIDPFGNIFQMVEASDWFMNENKLTGGTSGAIIGVSDIEKARIVYSDILGYNEIVNDSTASFKDFSGLPGGDVKIRRVLLKKPEPVCGPFGKLMGKSEIELISTGSPSEKKIYSGRFWGDPGFIHLCFDIYGMDNLKEFCSEKGHPFTVDSKSSREGESFDMGEAAGHFSYIEDPDGTLIELVETHKVPILKKLGWYIDLTTRDHRKNLPDWMLKTLRFSRVKSGKI